MITSDGGFQLRGGGNLVNKSQLDRNWHPQKSIKISSIRNEETQAKLGFLGGQEDKDSGNCCFLYDRPTL